MGSGGAGRDRGLQPAGSGYLTGRPEPAPARVHHSHLMASDVDATIAFWRDCFGAVVVADEAMAGSRNVFLDVGGGRLNLYDKAPNHRGPVNHLGVQVADLEATVEKLAAAGWRPGPIKTDGALGYAMVAGPDDLLIEVFRFDDRATPDHLRAYFDLPPAGNAGAQPAAISNSASKSRLASTPVSVPMSPDDDGVLGAGRLSAPASARLAGPTRQPLRPPAADDPVAVARWRQAIHGEWLAGDPPPSACGHSEVVIGGVRCLRAGPDQVDGRHRPLVVYFHGGGYALGSPEVALPITEGLAKSCEVVSVGYRLAPEHPYPAPIDDGSSVVDELAAEGRARPLVLAGDSAGANIALSVALARLASGPSQPIAAMLLLSPHLDHRSRSGAEDRDPLSDVDDRAGAWLNSAFRGRRPADDPAISPLMAELSGLPPTLVQAGTVDASLDDAVRFARMARAAGVDVTLDLWHGLWHTWHYHRELPEAGQALAEAARFTIRQGDR
ncbi:MAG: alpha/beta hydrolase fold domain-containing protein [Acidimicrobiales bacterium]